MTTPIADAPLAPNQSRVFIPDSIIAAGTDEVAPASALLEYREPPIAELPLMLSDYVAACAEAIGCDPCLVAMPALAACASAIGDSRAIMVKASWMELPILWSTVVAPSGALKTPAMKAAMEGLEFAQRMAFEVYQAEDEKYKTLLAQWRNSDKQGTEPKAPILKSYYTGDATLEAVGCLLDSNPRGLLQKRDELSGWLGGFDKYNEGNEAAQWLEFHSGNSVRIDRKSGDKKTIYLPRALVGVTGTIQQPILRKLLSGDDSKHFDNGLAARFLMAMPPERAREWREAIVPVQLTEKYRALFQDLLALQPQIDPATGRREPIRIVWSPEAKALYIEFFNRHAKEMRAFKSDRLKSAWSKLEAQAARLALIFHCVRHAYLPGPDSEQMTVSRETLRSALVWIEWLKNETRRIYFTLAHNEDARLADRVLRYARKCSGRCTAREAARVGAGGRTADAVEKVMQSLVVAGFGKWETPEQPNGGRPTRYFRLTTDGPAGAEADNGVIPP